MLHQTIYTKDAAARKITADREFDAPIAQVWKAWTDKDILDQWWAPKPWKANTKSMDFTEGGTWLYYMQGPEGERHYCRADFSKIVSGKSYSGDDSFCDEAGNIMKEPPGMHWEVEFSETATGTKVHIEITFASEADMQKIIEMGFEEGFKAAHGNLDELLAEAAKA